MVAAVVSGLLAAGFGVFGKVAVDKVFETLGRFKVDRALIEQRLQADPKMRWLQVLKDKQPATYAAFVDALLARVKGDVQEPFEQSIGYLRKTFVQPIFNANAPHLDDEAMTRYMSLVADQMEHFSAKNPRLCVLMLRDEPFGDARPYLTESLVAQELQLLEDALKVDKSTPRPIYSQAEQAQLMAVVMAQLTRQHGDLVQLMDPSTPVAGRERDVCTVGAALFRQIASLTAPQSATLMRSLLSAQK